MLSMERMGAVREMKRTGWLRWKYRPWPIQTTNISMELGEREEEDVPSNAGLDLSAWMSAQVSFTHAK
jgi:hypothetical protein